MQKSQVNPFIPEEVREHNFLILSITDVWEHTESSIIDAHHR